ncbi:patatin-like phospholipase family protein [Nocardia sp. NPDC046473]|uniref:patatin-like phospholipase family protein n=1 Tax=Nocardia sp. NPDC046473 TaxID=3155733 RepID=UPI0033D6D722
MTETSSPAPDRTALVLGGTGLVRMGWLVGLVIGLADRGIRLVEADRIVGTSGGALVSAMLTTQADLSRLLGAAASPTSPADPQVIVDALAPLDEPGLDLAQARRKAGAIAVAAASSDPQAHIGRMHTLIGTALWPQRDLVIAAVDIATGALHGWTRDGAASLPEAMAASTAVPGVLPPIPIDGHFYIDGGVGSSINAHLAAGADRIVIIEAMADESSHLPTDEDLGRAAVLTLVPDDASIAACGTDSFDLTRQPAAYDAGLRQSEDAAMRLQKFGWPTH